MITCPECSQKSPHGSLICTHCSGLLIDMDEVATEPTLDSTNGVTASSESVAAQRLPIPILRGELLCPNQPSLILYVIHVHGTDIREGEIWGAVPLRRLEVPHRIGRRDLTGTPHVIPEFDLHDLLKSMGKDGRKPVSRIHATLELQDGIPVIRHQSDSATTTWVRVTRTDRFIPLPPNQAFALSHRDVILLGKPGRHNVRLRVVLS